MLTINKISIGFLFSVIFISVNFADVLDSEKYGSQIKLQDIKTLVQRYVKTEDCEKRDKIKERIIKLENNPQKLKELFIDSIQYEDTQFGIHEKVVKYNNKEGKYFLYIPKGYDSKKEYPMIVSLHGVGEGGIAFMGRWLRHSKHEQKYIFLCPHYDSGYWWEKDGEGLVINSINQVCNEQNIDRNRIYLTGFSSGAHGAWYLSIRYPDIFAAVVPIAGECIISKQIANLLHVPAFIIHGDKDSDIPVDAARDARDRLQRLNYQIKYLEIPNQRHAYPVRKNNEVLDWFASVTKKTRPKTICFKGNLSEKKPLYWLQIDEFVKCFDLPDSTRVNSNKQSPFTNANSFSKNDCHIVNAKINKNKIILELQNITKVSLFLDDKLIDIRKPIEVIVNGKSKFTGLVKSKVESLFKSINRGFAKYSIFVKCVEVSA